MAKPKLSLVPPSPPPPSPPQGPPPPDLDVFSAVLLALPEKPTRADLRRHEVVVTALKDPEAAYASVRVLVSTLAYAWLLEHCQPPMMTVPFLLGRRLRNHSAGFGRVETQIDTMCWVRTQRLAWLAMDLLLEEDDSAVEFLRRMTSDETRGAQQLLQKIASAIVKASGLKSIQDLPDKPKEQSVSQSPSKHPFSLIAASMLAKHSRFSAMMLAERPPNGVPCNAMTSIWAWILAGKTPMFQGNRTYRGYSGAIRKESPGWWERALIWPIEGTTTIPDPWSSLRAPQEILGGTIVGPVLVGPDQDAPPLAPGFNLVQRHKGLEDGTVDPGDSGHAYIAELLDDGSVTIYQSSVDKGYRIAEGGTWEGTAGLAGYSVAVLQLGF